MAKPIDNISAQILAMESYDTTYGLYNHERYDKDRPLALQELHPKEDMITHSRWRATMRSFALHKVKDFFGINWNEYMDMTRWESNMMLEECREMQRIELAKNKEIQNRIEADKPKH